MNRVFLFIITAHLLAFSSTAMTGLKRGECIDNVGGSCTIKNDEIFNRLCCTTNGFVFCNGGTFAYAEVAIYEGRKRTLSC